ncbi:MAG: hypothetical protein V4547_15155 [Bacteroidota bacterium]
MSLTINTFFIKIKLKLQALAYCFSKQPLKYLVITSIVLITVIKLNLMGSGFLTFPDEFRFFAAEQTLHDLSELKIGEAMTDIFSTKSKPGDVILSTIPNAIQQLTSYIFNLYTYESNNSYPLFIFNFIIYCFILIVHYKVSKLVLKDNFLALLSVLLYSSLTNSYLYLRHVLAYDTSLLIFYLIIYKIFKYTKEDKLSFKISVLIGIGSFFGYLVYPGYFPLFFLGLFLLFFNNLTKKNVFNKIYHSFYYILGSIYCLLIFEGMSRLGGVSYISDALHASSIVNQGSSEESYTFIIKYLFEVEWVTGIILIICIPLFCLIMLNQIRNKTFQQNSLIMLLGIGVFGLYLAYASVGYFFNTLYLMGRSLHQYVPFICLFSLFSINMLLIKITKKKDLVLFMISLVFILNFGTNFIHYSSFSYPRDVYWKLNETTNLSNIENICEYVNGWSVSPDQTEIIDYSKFPVKAKTQPDTFVVTNCCFFYPVNDLTLYHKYTPDDSCKLIETKTHWLNFKAYQYEGINITERQIIDKINFQIKIFSKSNI